MLTETKNILSTLVGFDTTSSRSNLPLIEWVEAYLQGYGVKSQRIYSPDKQKANLLAVVGPMQEGGVVLSAHSDVVPTQGQPWSADPYKVRAENGRLYGRGTTDMKGFFAAMLAAVPVFQKQGLQRPVLLSISYDEEVGCLGVPYLIEQLMTRYPRPQAVLVGEPTGMQTAITHKGIQTMKTTVRGIPGHSSDPRGHINAIAAAADFIIFLEQLGQRYAENGPFCEGLEPACTTLNVGQIEGGIAANIVADDCRFIWEFRPIPGMTAADVMQQVDKYVQETVMPRLLPLGLESGVQTTVMASLPPFQEPPTGPAATLMQELTGNQTTIGVPFATEASHFKKAGLSTVVCGPGHVAQAHQPDEYIEESQLAACIKSLEQLGHRLSQFDVPRQALSA